LNDLAVIEKEVGGGAALSRCAHSGAPHCLIWAGAMITENQSQYEPFWALSDIALIRGPRRDRPSVHVIP